MEEAMNLYRVIISVLVEAANAEEAEKEVCAEYDCLIESVTLIEEEKEPRTAAGSLD